MHASCLSRAIRNEFECCSAIVIRTLAIRIRDAMLAEAGYGGRGVPVDFSVDDEEQDDDDWVPALDDSEDEDEDEDEYVEDEDEDEDEDGDGDEDAVGAVFDEPEEKTEQASPPDALPAKRRRTQPAPLPKPFSVLAGFTAGRGWLQGFLDRHLIASAMLHGEAASVNEAKLEEQRAELQKELANYAPRDIYNLDESALFFRNIGKQSYLLSTDTSTSGIKLSKMRITFVVNMNAAGDDIRPLTVIGMCFFIFARNNGLVSCWPCVERASWFVRGSTPWHTPCPALKAVRGLFPVAGKSENPRGFPRDRSQLPCLYLNSAKAWMTGTLFQRVLSEFDGDMRRQNRHVILLVDNFSGHHIDDDAFTNVKIKFLPPNTTSKLQPCDQGTSGLQCSCHHPELLVHACAPGDWVGCKCLSLRD
jgi:hypothetical protein